MERTALFYSILFLFLTVLAYLKFFKWRTGNNLPPSPSPAIPIIGHLHLIKQPLHRTLYKFSQICGPVFSIRFGSRLVVVVSSPALAEECFTKNDIVFANRPKTTVGKYIGYNYTSMVAAPYGDHWRNIRKLGANEIFAPHRINMFLSIRADETRRLLSSLCAISSHVFAKVEMQSKLTELTFNNVMRMMTGKRYFGLEEDNVEAQRFRELIRNVFKYGGASNPGDFVPFLRWIDYNNIEKSVKILSTEIDSFLQGLIEEHRVDRKSNTTMVDHLLTLQKSHPEYYTDELIKATMNVLLLAGTDTSSVTVEWALSALLNNPKVLEKARAEIDTFVGTNRLMEESDLSKLPYLHNVIQETFRMFPPGPLLVPHESSDACKIGGYDVPSGTMLLVNAWEIHRDPKVWDDAMRFKPERFEGVNVEPSKLMPFGIGRRSCPGSGLAQRVVGLALGSLIQCFEWERVGPEEVDLTEGAGLSMPKAVPLEARCKARDFVQNVLANKA